MKSSILILLIFFSFSIFGQTKTWDIKFIDSLLPNNKFIVADTILICESCKIDFFRNLINVQKDTVAKEAKYFYENKNPICITTDHVLLTTTTAKMFFRTGKVESFTIKSFAEGRQLFGELAKNGIVILDLKNKNLDADYLINIVKLGNREKNISIDNILINGIKTSDKTIKYFRWVPLSLDYTEKANTYDIKVE